MKLTPPDTEKPPAGESPKDMPKTGDELPWVAIVYALGAAA